MKKRETVAKLEITVIKDDVTEIKQDLKTIKEDIKKVIGNKNEMTIHRGLLFIIITAIIGLAFRTL